MPTAKNLSFETFLALRANPNVKLVDIRSDDEHAHDYNGQTVSSIIEEKHFNPRLQVANADEYAVLMRNLNLPEPKYMDVVVPANLRCGLSKNTNISM